MARFKCRHAGDWGYENGAQFMDAEYDRACGMVMPGALCAQQYAPQPDQSGWLDPYQLPLPVVLLRSGHRMPMDQRSVDVHREQDEHTPHLADIGLGIPIHTLSNFLPRANVRWCSDVDREQAQCTGKCAKENPETGKEEQVQDLQSAIEILEQEHLANQEELCSCKASDQFLFSEKVEMGVPLERCSKVEPPLAGLCDAEEPVTTEGAPPTAAARPQLPLCKDSASNDRDGHPSGGFHLAAPTPRSEQRQDETIAKPAKKQRISIGSNDSTCFPSDDEEDSCDDEQQCGDDRPASAQTEAADRHAIDEGRSTADAACQTGGEDCTVGPQTRPKALEGIEVRVGECSPYDLHVPNLLPYLSVQELLSWRLVSRRTRSPEALLEHLEEMGSMAHVGCRFCGNGGSEGPQSGDIVRGSLRRRCQAAEAVRVSVLVYGLIIRETDTFCRKRC
ncbi:unnamed protein product [Symbiodinium sp. CCMP2592]|nr:unnamed protein product [Symbiodinium sp. CCMP2592]